MLAGANGAPTAAMEIPWPFEDFFQPADYKVAYGGRGSGKSYTFAIMAVLRASKEKLRILCVREFQNSLSDSVHATIVEMIEALGLSSQFTILKNTIVSLTGSEFFFKGIRKDPGGIKSFHGADICFVEEAQNVSQKSWEVLLPTIRKAGAEVWVCFNPDSIDDPTYQMWVVNPPPGAIVRKINYDSNPYMSANLRKQMEHAKATDLDRYRHIWEGDPKSASDAQIFKDKFVSEGFETPADAEFMYGADWGFAVDPSVVVRCFVKDDILYIDHEAYQHGVETVDVPAFLARVPDSVRWPMRADSARPEVISHCQRHGFPRVMGVKKWSGSVEDGISFIRGLKKVVIHPRCKNVYDSFKFYSYKLDAGGAILPIPHHRFSDSVDAVRYALEPLITAKHEVRRVRVTGF